MKKILKFFLPIIVLALIYISLSIAPPFVTKRLVKDYNSVVITGHRGAAGLAPENTLPSIQKAIDLNVERIEIDVQQTKDSVVIVMHDTTVNRTTNGEGTIRNMTLDEIQALDAGSWYSAEYMNTKVPTLEEVIKAVKGNSVLVIEIKQGTPYYPGIENRVAALINKHDIKKSCIVHSFYDDVLFRMNKIDPDIVLHKLFIANSPFFYYDGDGFQFDDFEKYDFVEEFSIMHQFASKRFIRKAHEMGKKVNVWTVKNKKKGEKYISLNVDGLITDNPDFFRK